jgi:hypothetical protein
MRGSPRSPRTFGWGRQPGNQYAFHRRRCRVALPHPNMMPNIEGFEELIKAYEPVELVITRWAKKECRFATLLRSSVNTSICRSLPNHLMRRRNTLAGSPISWAPTCSPQARKLGNCLAGGQRIHFLLVRPGVSDRASQAAAVSTREMT